MIQVPEKTEFHVVVVRLPAPVKHPNADSLEMFDVDGATVISKIGNFKAGDLAVYVPVDSVVPLARPEFEFLKRPGHENDASHRLRAMRLRGIFSMGLLVPVPKEVFMSVAWAKACEQNTFVGMEVAELMGITKYERPSEMRLSGGPGVKKPGRKYNGPKLPVYGLDSLRKFKSVLNNGEVVVVTEKIHGTNARYCYSDGRLWYGSHNVMRGGSPTRISAFFTQVVTKVKRLLGMRTWESKTDTWWKIAEQYGLKEKLARAPGFILYGEIYGEGVQAGFPYDSPKGHRFRAFDVMEQSTGRFLDYDEFMDFIVNIGLNVVADVVPWIATMHWDEENAALMKKLADTGKSLIADHMIEGLVIKPYCERRDLKCGRVALKYVGETYLLKEA
jgi:RNA ligase (TIGR02306 family)